MGLGRGFLSGQRAFDENSKVIPAFSHASPKALTLQRLESLKSRYPLSISGIFFDFFRFCAPLQGPLQKSVWSWVPKGPRKLAGGVSHRYRYSK